MTEECNQAYYEIQLAEIGRLLNEFRERFQAGTTDAENFISISQIESMWLELQSNTQNIYSDIVRDLMSRVDERELVRKKKENTHLKG